MRIRLLPLIVMISFTLLGFKILDVLQHDSEVSDLLLVAETSAKSAEESPAETEAEENSDEEAAVEAATETPTAPPEPQYTEEKLELLKNLTKRREELEARERNMALQAVALEAAAKKMDERAKELKALEEQASLIIDEYLNKDKEKVKSLVKIYENMKPKDAARIFETMDMPIILEVVSNMKEAKAAPILAKMKPESAKNITTQIAEKRRLLPPDNSYRN